MRQIAIMQFKFYNDTKQEHVPENNQTAKNKIINQQIKPIEWHHTVYNVVIFC